LLLDWSSKEKNIATLEGHAKDGDRSLIIDLNSNNNNRQQHHHQQQQQQQQLQQKEARHSPLMNQSPLQHSHWQYRRQIWNW
jgi:hypothetical protein